jgi:hypothetical protein
MVPKVKRRRWTDVREEERVRFPEVFSAYEAFKQAVRAGKRPSPDRPFIVVERESELPTFANEAEEHEYWGTHTPGDAWMDAVASISDEEPSTVHNRSQTT